MLNSVHRFHLHSHGTSPHLYDMLCLCHMFGADHGAHLMESSQLDELKPNWGEKSKVPGCLEVTVADGSPYDQ